MSNYTIILFLCNWGPYTACQELQLDSLQISAGIRIVRIPCTGRISKSVLFKSFEMGADGVALLGCASGTCRHGTGTIAAINGVEEVKNIIGLLGLGRERIRLATFLPDDTEALKTFLVGFCKEIEALGKSTVYPIAEEMERPVGRRISIDAILKEHDVYSCQDCGKCTSSCPLSLSGKVYSPRAIATAAIRAEDATDQALQDIQSCLTCGVCHERCPSDVNFPEFIRDMRQFFYENSEINTVRPHGGFFHSMMRTMASSGVTPRRWDQISDDIQLDPQGKTLFFGGCAPYFDTFFQNDLGVKTTDILMDALRLLNFFNIHPRVLGGERCCGHDLLWSGDRGNFLRLAKLNVEMIRESGVEEVITACPECYRTLSVDYGKNGVKTGFKVTHLYEFLEKEIDKGGTVFHPLGKNITYQDSCRLNRLEGQRPFPRKLIGRLSGTEFTEMQDTGRSALCCGNCAWTRCDTYNKALQIKRLQQARESGSDLLITSCPKCQIHLRCAMEDPFIAQDLSMEMVDLTCVIAKTIHRE